jgi:hypothetical protein
MGGGGAVVLVVVMMSRVYGEVAKRPRGLRVAIGRSCGHNGHMCSVAIGEVAWPKWP